MLLNASNQLFFISCAADRKLPYSMKEVPIMAKTEIDVNQLPAGGIIATILAVFGARKIDTLWDAYQARR